MTELLQLFHRKRFFGCTEKDASLWDIRSSHSLQSSWAPMSSDSAFPSKRIFVWLYRPLSRQH